MARLQHPNHLRQPGSRVWVGKLRAGKCDAVRLQDRQQRIRPRVRPRHRQTRAEDRYNSRDYCDPESTTTDCHTKVYTRGDPFIPGLVSYRFPIWWKPGASSRLEGIANGERRPSLREHVAPFTCPPRSLQGVCHLGQFRQSTNCMGFQAMIVATCHPFRVERCCQCTSSLGWYPFRHRPQYVQCHWHSASARRYGGWGRWVCHKNSRTQLIPV